MKMGLQHSKSYDTAKAVLRGKFVVINYNIKKKEKSSYNQTLHLKELEKKEQTK